MRAVAISSLWRPPRDAFNVTDHRVLFAVGNFSAESSGVTLDELAADCEPGPHAPL